MRRRRRRRLYHGGAARGLARGGLIHPNMAEHRYVEGCPCCEAQRRGDAVLDPPTPPDWVYATTDRLYARYYASRAVKGDLYEVELIGDVERSAEDHFPTWRGRQARVQRVLDRGVTLTNGERRVLYKRWGGTDGEFEEMMALALMGFSGRQE